MTTTTTATLIQPEVFAGNTFAWRVETDDVAIADVIARPGGEPALHVHEREDETYVVLDGELTFHRGGERLDAAAGDIVFLPRGVEHGFALRSPQARVLVICTPGSGGLAAAFHALSQPAATAVPPSGPPSAEEINAWEVTFGTVGVRFTGPPLPVLLAAGQ
jgi:mannose-6-phosphate isomerase-like protein (cupin superfamily)